MEREEDVGKGDSSQAPLHSLQSLDACHSQSLSMSTKVSVEPMTDVLRVSSTPSFSLVVPSVSELSEPDYVNLNGPDKISSLHTTFATPRTADCLKSASIPNDRCISPAESLKFEGEQQLKSGAASLQSCEEPLTKKLKEAAKPVLSAWSIQNIKSLRFPSVTRPVSRASLRSTSHSGLSFNKTAAASETTLSGAHGRAVKSGGSAPCMTMNGHQPTDHLSLTSYGEDTLMHDDEIMLSVFYGGGKLGAAMFNSASRKLSVLSDISEGKPDYEILRSLIYQTNPDIVITSARHEEGFRNCVKECCALESDLSHSVTVATNTTAQEQAFKKSRAIFRKAGNVILIILCAGWHGTYIRW